MRHLQTFAAVAVALILAVGIMGVAPLSAQDESVAPAAVPDAQAPAALLIHPAAVSLAVGDEQVVTAWMCDASSASPRGADEEPGTKDDGCRPAKAAWSVRDASAVALDSDEGKKVRLRANAPIASTVVAARLGDVVAEAEVRVVETTAAQPKANPGQAKKAGPEANAAPAKKVGPRANAAPSQKVAPKANPGQAKKVAPKANAAPAKKAAPKANAAPTNKAAPKANAAPTKKAAPKANAQTNRGQAKKATPRAAQPKTNPGQSKKVAPKSNAAPTKKAEPKTKSGPVQPRKAGPTAEPNVEPAQPKKAGPRAAQSKVKAAQPRAKSNSGQADRLIVTFKPGVGKARQLGVVSNAGAGNGKALGRQDMRVVKVPRNERAEVVGRLKAHPAVKHVDPDYERVVNADPYVPNDPAYVDQWNLKSTMASQDIKWDIAYDPDIPTGNAVVAILDTGVDSTHPDLAGQLESGSATTDPNGHGTWMAGIVAAATNNNVGIAGVAWAGVTVLPIAVIGADGVGYDSQIIAGIEDAKTAGADVILMAFSGPNESAALAAAIAGALAQGIVVVASVGNEKAASYPAGHAGVIGVAATRKDGSVAPYSDDGPAAYIAAPGADIPTLNVGGGTRLITGTSPAAAQVAGAAALLRANGVSAVHVAGRLSTTARYPAAATIGLLDLAAALNATTTDEVVPSGDPSGPDVTDGASYFVEPTPTPTPTPTPAPTPTPKPTPKPTPWPTPAGIAGLDVSHWNGLPDFKALRAQGQRFVFSKATQGTSFVDDTYEQHTADARAAGLLAGAYHFFDYRVDGTKQAQHFLSTVRKTSGLNRLLPLVVDVETLKSLGTPDKAKAKNRLRAMLDELYRQTGRYPMIYTSRYMWEKVVGAPAGFGNHPLWVACWKCDDMYLPNGWNDWTFWQWGLARFDDDVNLDGNVYSAGMGQLNLERARPMQLENGSEWAGSRSVEADLRGFDGAQVRYAVGKGTFRPWQPYQKRSDVTLGRRQGTYDVRIQLRSPNQVKSPIVRDTIKLDKTRPKLTKPQISIRQGGRVAASGKRVPTSSTISAKDALSGLKITSLKMLCGGKRVAVKSSTGPRLTLDAAMARSGCSINGAAKDAVGHIANKSVSPRLRTIDVRRGSQSVKLRGPWKAAKDKNALGRTLARTTSKGAQAKVTFRGQQFAVVAHRGPTGGRVKVIVDGKHVDTIDLYASKSDDRRIVYVRNVPKGKHVVKLRSTGTANAKSTGRTVWLDGVVVLDRRK